MLAWSEEAAWPGIIGIRKKNITDRCRIPCGRADASCLDRKSTHFSSRHHIHHRRPIPTRRSDFCLAAAPCANYLRLLKRRLQHLHSQHPALRTLARLLRPICADGWGYGNACTLRGCLELLQLKSGRDVTLAACRSCRCMSIGRSESGRHGCCGMIP